MPGVKSLLGAGSLSLLRTVESKYTYFHFDMF